MTSQGRFSLTGRDVQIRGHNHEKKKNGQRDGKLSALRGEPLQGALHQRTQAVLLTQYFKWQGMFVSERERARFYFGVFWHVLYVVVGRPCFAVCSCALLSLGCTLSNLKPAACFSPIPTACIVVQLPTKQMYPKSWRCMPRKTAGPALCPLSTSSSLKFQVQLGSK